ncbi:hypothetical protein L596_002678 [Steinernema carpocapsae]|uniref:Uncharacterized protein n=1 Tax=Steinernema carpocapsae TaxID=34508 RepID=A0A4U8UPX4_STECR|nr:hypothetical protein L596_002678 [Steinernema carpocapsae]
MASTSPTEEKPGNVKDYRQPRQPNREQPKKGPGIPRENSKIQICQFASAPGRGALKRHFVVGSAPVVVTGGFRKHIQRLLLNVLDAKQQGQHFFKFN